MRHAMHFDSDRLSPTYDESRGAAADHPDPVRTLGTHHGLPRVPAAGIGSLYVPPKERYATKPKLATH